MRISGWGLLLSERRGCAAIRRQRVQQAGELLGGGKFQRDAGRLHPSTRELQLCASVPRNYGNERHRHLIHHHDQLDAFGIAMRFARASSLARCERGAMAAEFAVLFPALVSTLLGIIWASLLTYSAPSRHYPV